MELRTPHHSPSTAFFSFFNLSISPTTNVHVRYGAGDTFGSGNCNTATAACGWYSNPGYNAAASQNLFGVGPGAGAGPGCGLCFRVTAKTDPYANNAPLTGTQSIVIKVNNLCPADGNPLCSQSSLTDTNSLGMSDPFLPLPLLKENQVPFVQRVV